MIRFRAVLFSILCFTAWGFVHAGLHDILPRPQQMGQISFEPVPLSGMVYVIFPDDTLNGEGAARAEVIRVLSTKLGYSPTAVNWSDYENQTPSIWAGVSGQFPELNNALAATGITGLGDPSHDEEYQIYVGDDRIYLLAEDLRGLRWSAISLVKLIGEIYGQYYVDRVYIRDWPDYPRRITAINSPMRVQSQLDYCNNVADSAYLYKLTDIEWNDSDAGRPDRRSFYRNNATAFRRRIADRGQKLYMSVDRTANKIEDYSWHEAVPCNATKMTVTSTGFVPVAGGFNITVTNGGMETWTSGRPTGWEMHFDSLFSHVSRDQVTKHSGTSSTKFTGFYSGMQELTLRRPVNVGAQRWVAIKFWYKASNYSGDFRLMAKTDDMDQDCLMQTVAVGSNVTCDWTQVTVDFCTFNFDTLTLMIGPENATAGTVWMDDITIETAVPEHIVRRNDTPVRVYEEPGHILRVEGTDYQIVETHTSSYNNFVREPRFERISGGALAVNDVVTIDWSCAFFFQLSRETVCFSRLEPLEEYQQRIRNVDSLLAPDGIKIQINEVSYANYDVACTSRNMTSGQLVGSYCNTMYEIIQSHRPNSPVRIYGDPFDIWVADPRAHPMITAPWTVGALDYLDPSVEMIVMTDYSENLDSSIVYFGSNGHPTIVASSAENNFTAEVNSALAIRRYPEYCVGMEFYTWSFADYDQLVDFSGLVWNMGPFLIHAPVTVGGPTDSAIVTAELWSDPFRLSVTPSITSATVTYRWLPATQWTTVPMTVTGPHAYRRAIPPGGGGATELQYYITATDHRNQTSRSPANAPTEIHSVQFGSASAPGAVQPFSLLSPQSFDTIFSPAALLVWQRAEDSDPFDIPHYDIWLDTLADMSTAWLADAGVSDTIFTLINLSDNKTYYWTVRATDSNSPGMWANEVFSFRTNIPSPPRPFYALLPVNNMSVNRSEVTVNWRRSTDPDANDIPQYVVEWSSEPDYTPLYSATTSDTFYLISDMSAIMRRPNERIPDRNRLDELPDDAPVYWRVKAVDRFGLFVWSNSGFNGRVFYVGVPEGPEPFNLLSPGRGDTVWSCPNLFRWDMTFDPDPANVPRYELWMDTLPNLATAQRIVSNIIPWECWVSTLVDNERYYWTVHATDINTPGTWASDTLFFDTYFPQASSQFDLHAPSAGAVIPDDVVTFEWKKSIEQDPGDSVRYTLHLVSNQDSVSIEVGEDTTLTLPVANWPIQASEMAWFVSAYSNLPDTTILSNQRFDLTLPTLDADGFGAWIPEDYYFNQNYPNPFNPETTIEYGLPVSANVTVRVYDVLGREVDRLVDKFMPAGRYSVTWNCHDCSSGAYLFVMSAGEFSMVRRALLLR